MIGDKLLKHGCASCGIFVVRTRAAAGRVQKWRSSNCDA
jgi:hypothetical protein